MAFPETKTGPIKCAKNPETKRFPLGQVVATQVDYFSKLPKLEKPPVH